MIVTINLVPGTFILTAKRGQDVTSLRSMIYAMFLQLLAISFLCEEIKGLPPSASNDSAEYYYSSETNPPGLVCHIASFREMNARLETFQVEASYESGSYENAECPPCKDSSKGESKVTTPLNNAQ